MTLLTQTQYRQLLENGSSFNTGRDHFPVVKFCFADAAGVCLLTELDPDESDTAFGLCDFGTGYPELGYISLRELASYSGRLGLPVMQDGSFTARYPVSIYARAAQIAGAFTEDARLLSLAHAEPVRLPARAMRPQP